MPLYRLNLHECGIVLHDVEGIERADLAGARDAAITGARGIMAAELGEGRLCLSCHIEIEDAAGAIVMTVPFGDAVSVTGVR